MSLYLAEMSENDLVSYRSEALPSYAREKMKGEGLSEQKAMEIAKASFDSLLSNGVNSENQFLYLIKDGENNVGMLWFAKKSNGNNEYAFVYDIELKPAYRGKGLGTMAMELLEEKVKSLGLKSIGLHVFGHNEIAISLYEKMGFRTTNRIMMKDL